MTQPIGMNPGTVYSQTDQLRGKCPTAGVTYHDHLGGKVFQFCLITASANITDGMLVQLDGTGGCTQVGTAGSARTGAQKLGVARATVTASLSALIWVQVYGPGTVLASASCNPNVLLSVGSVAGTVDDAIGSASALIDGIHLTATAATSTPTAAILNYPRFVEGA